jgi:hypothetical protein
VIRFDGGIYKLVSLLQLLLELILDGIESNLL